MRTMILVLVLLATGCSSPQQPAPQPKSLCGSTCSSNTECGQGITKPCPFCNFGTCRFTRPESPTERLRCMSACSSLPRPLWCDLGGCASVLRDTDPAPQKGPTP